MKRKMLLFISLLAMSQLLFSQATISCFPGSEDYHTGTTDGSEFTETSVIKTQSASASAGWARFDLSEIPEGATIQSVELNLYIVEDNVAYWRVMSIEDDPLDGTAESVFTDCTDGDQYFQYNANFPEPSWWQVDLGTLAVEDVQDQMADGWFGVSVWEYETGGTYAITCDGWNEDNPPYISVTYLQPGAPLPPYNPYPIDNAQSVDIDVDLTWDFGDDTETYDVYFGTEFPPTTLVVDNETPGGVSGIYDPGTMEFNTMYYWQVVAKNADYETPGPMWSFITACDAFEMSIFEDFNTTAQEDVPYCWTAVENTTTFAYAYTVTYNGIDGTNSFYMYNSNDAAAELMLVTPKLSGGAAGKYANFFSWGYNDLSVGTITDPSDPTTYTEVAVISPSNTYQDYQEFEVFFNNYTGDDEYIAFKGIYTMTYQGIYLDNITIDFAPTCPKPSDLYAGGSTTTTATIGWTENGDATAWDIEYGYYGFEPDGEVDASADSNPFELTGLEASTVYQFYVRAACGEGEESWWVGPQSFQTQCETFDLPYFEGFEDVETPNLPPCNIMENTNGDDKVWYTYNDINYAYEGSQYIRIDYTYANDMDDWFFSPPLNLVGGETYIVDFYYTCNSTYYIENLEVKWGTDALSSEMTEGPIFADDEINYGYVWHEGIGYFTPETDGVYFVGWHGYSILGQYYLMVDDITIDVAPTCLKPLDLVTEDISQNTASIGWTESADATMWDVEYGETGFEPGSGISVVADSNPFELTDLFSGTTYDFYVRANCGDGDVSWWEGPETFTTLCDAMIVPILEDFDLAISPDLPDCWRSLESTTGTGYVQTYAWGGYSAPQSLVLANQNDTEASLIAISPQVAADDGVAGKWVRFYAWGYAPELAVGSMSNPYDASTFTAAGIVELTGVYNDWQEYEVYFTNYSGDDQFIAFKGIYTNTYETIYIDDVEINHPPSCPKPTDLFSSDVETNTVTLNWQENGITGTWNVEYGVVPFTPTGVPTISGVTENPYILTDLLSGTQYDWYVQADCGEGDQSEWSKVSNFTTLCEAFEVAVVESFDNVTSPELPPCWIPLVESTNQYAMVDTYQWTNYSAPNSLRMYNSGDALAEIFAVSPMLVDPVSELWVNFFTYGYAPELIVGTISDPLDYTTFTGVDTVAIINGWVEQEVFFGDYTGTDMFIAFKPAYTGTYQEVFVDNITIDHPPTCPKPKDLASSNATTTTIDLDWSENGEATAWNIEYGYGGFVPGEGTIVIADSNPYVLTGLEDGTWYEYYVQSACGEGDVSYWVGPHPFKTLCYSASLPYTEDFEDITPPLVPPCVSVENSNYDAFFWQSTFDNPYTGLSNLWIGYTYNNPMDDWFFSAPLDLLGGQTYNVSFYYTNNSTYYTEKLEVKFGMEPTGDGMTSDPIFTDENINYGPDDYQHGYTSFTPDETGTYFVGWHGYSEPGQYYLYVDSVYIEWDNSLVIEATATPDTICQGTEAQLNGSAVGGSGDYSYSWTSDPEGFTSTEADPFVSPDVTTDYILEVYDTFVSVFDTVTVQVTQLPETPGTPSGITFFCASWGTATYSTSGASGANWYDWSVEPVEAASLTGTGTSVSVEWADGWLGSAVLTVTGMQNECAGPPSTGLSVMVYLPTVTLPTFEDACIEWPAYELTGGTPAGGEYTGPGVEDGMFDPVVAGIGTHTITYTYSDAANCENFAEATITVDVCDGIDEYGNVQMTVTPNPNDGIFTLKVKAKSAQKVNIKVMNNFGEEVYNEPNVDLHANYSREIDLSSYAKGLYYLYIYSDDFNHVEKIIVK